MSAVIKLSNINKQYKMGEQVFKALDDINIEIAQNEYVAIIGPSGSGKSTLMNLLGCLDTPTSGDYYLKDKLVKRMTETELAHQRNESVGFIFQSFNLLPRASALENVMQPLVPKSENNKRSNHYNGSALAIRSITFRASFLVANVNVSLLLAL
jgi:putative ABC transport system ATP-binding protein